MSQCPRTLVSNSDRTRFKAVFSHNPAILPGPSALLALANLVVNDEISNIGEQLRQV